jgi:DNA-3-methyladenine glycosylase
MILKSQFYNQPTIKVAQNLLGCFLVRKNKGKIIKTMIVETEAYDGPNDLASHASRGKTTRNQVMFGKPGTIYVYFTYGMHYMLNIVTDESGYPAAVLIRAVEPVTPPLLTKKRVGVRLKTNGPAKLTKALQIDKTFNGLSVCTKKHGLWIECRAEPVNKKEIVRVKRIGVDYAGEYKDKLWRFYLKNSPFVSKK